MESGVAMLAGGIVADKINKSKDKDKPTVDQSQLSTGTSTAVVKKTKANDAVVQLFAKHLEDLDKELWPHKGYDDNVDKDGWWNRFTKKLGYDYETLVEVSTGKVPESSYHSLIRDFSHSPEHSVFSLNVTIPQAITFILNSLESIFAKIDSIYAATQNNEWKNKQYLAVQKIIIDIQNYDWTKDTSFSQWWKNIGGRFHFLLQTLIENFNVDLTNLNDKLPLDALRSGINGLHHSLKTNIIWNIQNIALQHLSPKKIPDSFSQNPVIQDALTKSATFSEFMAYCKKNSSKDILIYARDNLFDRSRFYNSKPEVNAAFYSVAREVILCHTHKEILKAHDQLMLGLANAKKDEITYRITGNTPPALMGGTSTDEDPSDTLDRQILASKTQYNESIKSSQNRMNDLIIILTDLLSSAGPDAEEIRTYAESIQRLINLIPEMINLRDELDFTSDATAALGGIAPFIIPDHLKNIITDLPENFNDLFDSLRALNTAYFNITKAHTVDNNGWSESVSIKAYPRAAKLYTTTKKEVLDLVSKIISAMSNANVAKVANKANTAVHQLAGRQYLRNAKFNLTKSIAHLLLPQIAGVASVAASEEKDQQEALQDSSHRILQTSSKMLLGSLRKGQTATSSTPLLSSNSSRALLGISDKTPKIKRIHEDSSQALASTQKLASGMQIEVVESETNYNNSTLSWESEQIKRLRREAKVIENHQELIETHRPHFDRSQDFSRRIFAPGYWKLTWLTGIGLGVHIVLAFFAGLYRLATSSKAHEDSKVLNLLDQRVSLMNTRANDIEHEITQLKEKEKHKRLRSSVIPDNMMELQVGQLNLIKDQASLFQASINSIKPAYDRSKDFSVRIFKPSALWLLWLTGIGFIVHMSLMLVATLYRVLTINNDDEIYMALSNTHDVLAKQLKALEGEKARIKNMPGIHQDFETSHAKENGPQKEKEETETVTNEDLQDEDPSETHEQQAILHSQVQAATFFTVTGTHTKLTRLEKELLENPAKLEEQAKAIVANFCANAALEYSLKSMGDEQLFKLMGTCLDSMEVNSQLPNENIRTTLFKRGKEALHDFIQEKANTLFGFASKGDFVKNLKIKNFDKVLPQEKNAATNSLSKVFETCDPEKEVKSLQIKVAIIEKTWEMIINQAKTPARKKSAAV